MQSFFVSSTFKDMQGERDVMHRLVMPKLRERAREYGENIQFVDLRWGIPTSDMDSDASAGKILSVCLDEIRQCKPYMIILLGERYGWMPSPQLLQNAAEDMNFSLDNYEMSVTELEIRYGMLQARDQLNHCIFCLRDPVPGEGLDEEQRSVYKSESGEDQRRMRLLKEKICANPSAIVLRYRLEWDQEQRRLTGYEQFAERLEVELEKMLSSEWSARKNLSWQERQREEDQLLSEYHLGSFAGRGRELDELTAQIDSHSLVVLEGESGSGKSAMMARLCEKQQERGRMADVFYCGNSPYCDNTGELLKLLCWYLARMQGKEEPHLAEDAEDEDWRDLYFEMMKNYRGEELTLFIDAIDQLAPDRALYESWFIPPRFSPFCTLVVSTTKAVQINPIAIPSGKDKAAACKTNLLPPSEEELREILDALFASEHKQISEGVAKQILANPCSKNMLGMEVIVQRLVMLGEKDFQKIAHLEKTMSGAQAQDVYLSELVTGMSSSLDVLIQDYMEAVLLFLGEQYADQLRLLIYIVAVFRHGISVTQLERMSEFIRTDEGYNNIPQDHIWKNFWDPIVFSRLKRYLGNFLIQRSDGRIDFAHRRFREALLSAFWINRLASPIRYWLYMEPQGDDTRQENILVLNRMLLDELTQDGREDDGQSKIYLENVIIDAGRLSDSENPQEAAEGKRQLEMLKRSLIQDLSGPDGQAHLSTYCKLLDQVIMDENGPNSYPVWFFAVELVSFLKEQSEREIAFALQILARILSSLHTQKQLFERGEERYRDIWTNGLNMRFVTYHVNALECCRKVGMSLRQGDVEKVVTYGLDPDKILEAGLREADLVIQKDPDNPGGFVRKALMYAYAAGCYRNWSVGIRKDVRVEYAKKAAECGKKGLECANRTGKSIAFTKSRLLQTTGIGVEILTELNRGTLLFADKLLKQADQLYEQVWKDVEISGGLGGLDVASVSMFLKAGTQCQRFKNNKTRLNQTVDRCGGYYYGVYENHVPVVRQKDRVGLASLGVILGKRVLEGYIPAIMKVNGYTRRTTLQYIIARESAFIQAGNRRDMDAQYEFMLIRIMEAVCEENVHPDLCVEYCDRALDAVNRMCELMTHTVATGVYYTEEMDSYRDYLERIREAAKK